MSHKELNEMLDRGIQYICSLEHGEKWYFTDILTVLRAMKFPEEEESDLQRYMKKKGLTKSDLIDTYGDINSKLKVKIEEEPDPILDFYHKWKGKKISHSLDQDTTSFISDVQNVIKTYVERKNNEN